MTTPPYRPVRAPEPIVAGLLYSRRAVEQFTGKSRSSLYLDMERGTFPKPVKTGARSIAWKGEDLLRWLDGLKPAAIGATAAAA